MRGIYTASGGMLNQNKRMNVTSNNLSNLDTAGYKKDSLITEGFGNYIAYRMSPGEGSAEIGGILYGSKVGDAYTSYGQGALEDTGRTLDLALEGEGFFALQRQDGTRAYTRNGQFFLSEQGYLTDGTGALLLGQNGPLKVGTSDFLVDSQGDVSVGSKQIDTLLLIRPTGTGALVKQTGGLYTLDGNQQLLPFEGAVKQGSLERSNVDATEEMTDIISESRAYQSCAQMIRMMDEIQEKTVNEIAKV